MGKKTKLKATLSSHQEKQRQGQLQKAREAAKKEVLKNGPSAKSKGKQRQRQPKLSINPFAPSDSILLIGEGNFSFARALFTHIEFLPPANVTATTNDSEEACYAKYPDAQEIIAGLREKGVEVLFSVDARRLETCKELKRKKWQKVVWNFPHAGKGISDQDRNVLSNQILILDFLKSVAPLLEQGAIPSPSRAQKNRRRTEDESEEEGVDYQQGDDDAAAQIKKAAGIKERGTVLITLRNTSPYTLWNLPSLAKKPPLPHPSSCSPSIPHPQYIQIRSFSFQRQDWKGYEHRMTKGWVDGLGTGADNLRATGEGRTEDRTWEFCLAD